MILKLSDSCIRYIQCWRLVSSGELEEVPSFYQMIDLRKRLSVVERHNDRCLGSGVDLLSPEDLVDPWNRAHQAYDYRKTRQPSCMTTMVNGMPAVLSVNEGYMSNWRLLRGKVIDVSVVMVKRHSNDPK